MPKLIILQRISKFLSRYAGFQAKLEEVENSLAVERLMQTLASIPAEELKSRLASSAVSFESLNQSAEHLLEKVQKLIDAEKIRRDLHNVSIAEIRRLDEMLVEVQKRWKNQL